MTELSFDTDSDFDIAVPPTNDVAPTREHHPVDVASDAFWSGDSPERERTFRLLRETAPVTWQRTLESAVSPDPDDPGFWAVVKHADIVEVSRRSDVFVSGFGVFIDLIPPMLLEMGMSILALDGDQHHKLRRLVSSAFTPRQIARIEDDIATRAQKIVAGAVEKGSFDFVEDLSRHLPIDMFADMFGIPDDLKGRFAHAADEMVAWTDPVNLAGRDPVEVQAAAILEIHEMGEELAEARRAEPADDLISALVHAEVDGQQLDNFQIGAFLNLCSVAATDTTRHTTTIAAKALTDFPDQRAWLWADFDARIASAVEEFLRWGSVVLDFRRTAVEPYVLRGQEILPGDKLVLMYSSGNWDTGVFTDPDVLDLSRNPNPHIAFGGGGAHFCLGSQLAKSMLRNVFREIHRQMPDFVTGEPVFQKTNFVRGVTSMPCTVRG